MKFHRNANDKILTKACYLRMTETITVQILPALDSSDNAKEKNGYEFQSSITLLFIYRFL